MDSVKALIDGDGLFANPSSAHADGKRSKNALADCRDFIYGLFGLEERDFRLVFHSGATEGINNIVKGFALRGAPVTFAYLETDHSCVVAQRKFLEDMGHRVLPLGVDGNGQGDVDHLIGILKDQKRPVLLNWTWVNNETGVVSTLEDALKIKEEAGVFVHVDAVQSPGKIAEWKSLLPGLDAYTYSGHKFGALKGVGFSFIGQGVPLRAMVEGGGQQGGMRSGTENLLGIRAIAAALDYLDGHFDYASLREARDYLVLELERALGDGGFVAAAGARRLNAQTVCLVFRQERSDIVSVAFDLGGIDVSTGSACSSGGMRPSRVLSAMGFADDLARSAIRLSFSPYVDKKAMREYADKIVPIVSRFANSGY